MIICNGVIWNQAKWSAYNPLFKRIEYRLPKISDINKLNDGCYMINCDPTRCVKVIKVWKLNGWDFCDLDRYNHPIVSFDEHREE